MIRTSRIPSLFGYLAFWSVVAAAATEFPLPYSPPCTERQEVFEFTQRPQCQALGNDRYELRFAVKGYCDVTVGIVDEKGTVVRHLASGVLGANAPAPFQKGSLQQTIYWNGKDDLDHYVKDPERLRVRVMLGLQPRFDKHLGGSGGKNLTHGYALGIAVNSEAAYVFFYGTGGKAGRSATLRRYDHEGAYQACLAPPARGRAEETLQGLSYVEYEKGVRAVHGANVLQSVADRAHFLPGLNKGTLTAVQPAFAGNRLFWVNSGIPPGSSAAYYLNADGSFEVEGLKGLPLGLGEHRYPICAASPDGKWLYLTQLGAPLVYRRATGGGAAAEPFLGKYTIEALSGGRKRVAAAPGSDEQSLNNPTGLACDGAGRIYVVDSSNNRIQVFAPEGRFLKSIPIERPRLVCVHQKSGALYVVHSGRVQGKSVDRISKLASLENPTEVFHVDGLAAAVLALDSWTPRPRLWLAGSRYWVDTTGGGSEGPGVRIYEEDGLTLKKISDFDEEDRKAAGEGWFGGQGTTRKVICDPVRETVVYGNTLVLDLKSGANRGEFRVKGFSYDDIAFDKKGYLHLHWNPCFEFMGVSRVDPSRASLRKDKQAEYAFYPEVPYDYGVEETEKRGWAGIIPVKDQCGAKGFQDGLGVNMRGDVATQTNIYFVPRMEELGREMVDANIASDRAESGFTCGEGTSYADFIKTLQEREKRGEEIYFIRRRPGIPLAGATIWTFESTGEMSKECAVNMGDLINGVMLDEEGGLYFVTSRPRVFDPSGSKYFLAGRGGTIGVPQDTANRHPFTGTLIKRRPGQECVALQRRAPVPLEPPPDRRPEVMAVEFADVFGKEAGVWIEGAEWLYAGASPIVSTGCSCPTQRLHTDWYKRTFVPEVYRHSFGVLDSAGNLVLHLGRFGNFDDARAMKPGDADIAVGYVRFISGTDNYLCFEDWSERLTVLKLAYQVEETVPLK